MISARGERQITCIINQSRFNVCECLRGLNCLNVFTRFSLSQIAFSFRQPLLPRPSGATLFSLFPPPSQPFFSSVSNPHKFILYSASQESNKKHPYIIDKG